MYVTGVLAWVGGVLLCLSVCLSISVTQSFALSGYHVFFFLFGNVLVLVLFAVATTGRGLASSEQVCERSDPPCERNTAARVDGAVAMGACRSLDGREGKQESHVNHRRAPLRHATLCQANVYTPPSVDRILLLLRSLAWPGYRDNWPTRSWMATSE
jgi:hypothetical protein